MSAPSIVDDDYHRALAFLRSNSPITEEIFFRLVGRTINGGFVFLPQSYRKGYRDSLLPDGERPHYILNLVIIGQLTDGTLVFPPSYDEGLKAGLNDLRFAILAEGEKRLFQETHKLSRDNKELQKKLLETQEMAKELISASEREKQPNARGEI